MILFLNLATVFAAGLTLGMAIEGRRARRERIEAISRTIDRLEHRVAARKAQR